MYLNELLRNKAKPPLSMSQASQTFLWAEETDCSNTIFLDSCFWGWAQTIILGK